MQTVGGKKTLPELLSVVPLQNTMLHKRRTKKEMEIGTLMSPRQTGKG
jgi:hypothetical protein